jgi:RNA methyltransferase, RsmD family
MRITGGKYVRRIITCPPGVIRPAMDMMRESMFMSLGPLDGKSFLDLFSGSGCVAIEAASRGAAPIHLVEMDRGKKAVIEKNLSIVEEPHQLFMTDVNRFIASSVTRYDLVYADPPFPMEGKVELTRKIAEAGIVKEGGLFMIHYPREEGDEWPEHIPGFEFLKEKRYGRSLLRYYRASSAKEDK